MAFKQTLAQRLFGISRISNAAVTNCRISNPCTAAQSKALNNGATKNKRAPDPGDDGIFRRYLHGHSAAAGATTSHEFRFLQTGEKLLEKLREMDISRDRIRLDGLIRPAEDSTEGNLTVKDAVKILRISQLDMVKSRLRQVEKDCVSYSEFLEICGRDCSSSDQGLEFAKMLDQSGCVIVLGNIVYLRPEQVVKAIQSLIRVPSAHDPRMKELEELEKHKTAIDSKARLLVQRELLWGLGYMFVQTAAFMRLTFWELSWDVMEPICFYVTSLHFMGGYAFFLRTLKEPTFEGFFNSRFSAKQKRLIKSQNFDIERYNELKKLFYPQSPAPPRENAVAFSSPAVL